MKLTKVILATSLIAGATFSYANDAEFGIQAGYGTGGDLVLVNSNSDIEAGDGLILGVFGLIPVSNDGTVLVKLGANYTTISESFSDADLKLDRFALDALILKKFEKFQIGAGIVYHISPTLDIDYNSTSSNSDLSLDADNELGLALEVAYNFTDSFNVGLRYTNIDYEYEVGTSSFDRDGSNVSITAGYTFK